MFSTIYANLSWQPGALKHGMRITDLLKFYRRQTFESSVMETEDWSISAGGGHEKSRSGSYKFKHYWRNRLSVKMHLRRVGNHRIKHHLQAMKNKMMVNVITNKLDISHWFWVYNANKMIWLIQAMQMLYFTFTNNLCCRFKIAVSLPPSSWL